MWPQSSSAASASAAARPTASQPPILPLAAAEASVLRSACTIPTLTAAAEELVLNSLEAGATEVSVSVDVPRLSLQVRDNGHGIGAADLARVGARGASSKRGARGEALHALAAVSLLEVVSHAAAEAGGAHAAVLQLGRRLSLGPAREARGVGTSVTVRELFANRAVARRALRREGGGEAELAALREAIGRLAVGSPHAAFRLHDGARDATLLRTAACDSALAVLRQVEAKLELPPMAELCYGDDELRLDGHLALPPHGAGSRGAQLLFVNRRALSRRAALHRLVEAACARLADGLAPRPLAPHAAFVLRLHADGGAYPCCFERRGEERGVEVAWGGGGEGAVRRFVVGALAHLFAARVGALHAEAIEAALAPLADGAAARRGRGGGGVKRRRDGGGGGGGRGAFVLPAVEAGAAAGEAEIEALAEAAEAAARGARRRRRAAGGAVQEGAAVGMACVLAKDGLHRMRALGQVERKFIAAYLDGTLLAVDQHAADERVQLEALQAKTYAAAGGPRAGAVEAQWLRPARALRLTAREQSAIQLHSAPLAAWGWRCGGGGATLRLEAAPRVEGVLLDERAMLEYAAALQRSGGCSTQPPPAVARVLASKACRRAVMFGHTLPLGRCQAILRALARCDLPFQCAHGRPTVAPLLQLRPLMAADGAGGAPPDAERKEGRASHALSLEALRARGERRGEAEGRATHDGGPSHEAGAEPMAGWDGDSGNAARAGRESYLVN
ncbi:hypothetical protein AB1Y20_012681 [Prymnesium parvum]|uniref:MutL C-terminal dimerisation domain-containing protein n=1 Tax=Prymnesium parvum TaxID=97485 RepID=A0AB34IIJ9_PRYPA